MKANISIGNLIFKCDDANVELSDLTMQCEYDKDEIVILADKFYQLVYGLNDKDDEIPYEYHATTMEQDELASMPF